LALPHFPLRVLAFSPDFAYTIGGTIAIAGPTAPAASRRRFARSPRIRFAQANPDAVFPHAPRALDTPPRFGIQHCIVPIPAKGGKLMIVYRELSSLERDLGFSARTLYGLSNHIEGHYRRVEIPKRGGGTRTLSVPDAVLKSVQGKIAQVLLPQMPISVYAKAYRDCSSILDNARPHIGKPAVLKLDILRFFDSVRYSMVKDAAFPAWKYSEPLRILLAMLCYYRDSLPQGAPSSPAITNLILYGFDQRIGAWCRGQGIAYTRYCDDMAFSGDFDAAEVVSRVREELGKQGFLLNRQKTRLQRPGTRQSVTGVVVNERAHTPVEYRRKLRQELYYCQKYGAASHLERTGSPDTEALYIQRLLGRVNFALQVDPSDQALQRARAWLTEQEQRGVPR